jgi:hypothetical protein
MQEIVIVAMVQVKIPTVTVALRAEEAESVNVQPVTVQGKWTNMYLTADHHQEVQADHHQADQDQAEQVPAEEEAMKQVTLITSTAFIDLDSPTAVHTKAIGQAEN